MTEHFNKIYKDINNQGASIGKHYIIGRVQTLEDALKNAVSNGVSIEPCYKKMRRVEDLRKFDILYCLTMGVPHYVMVCNITEEHAIVLILSSKDKSHSLHEVKGDRGFEGSFFTNSLLTIPIEDAKDRFVRTYEDKKEARVVIRKLKKYYREVLR